MNGRIDKQMNGRNFSPFYRTLSPTGAAAQKAGDFLYWGQKEFVCVCVCVFVCECMCIFENRVTM